MTPETPAEVPGDDTDPEPTTVEDPGPVKVSFLVDMDGADTSAGVWIHGEVNGWCGDCQPLEDGDGDGVWETTLELVPGTYQYLYVTNPDGQWTEEVVPVGCDLYPEDEDALRYVEVGEVDMTAPLHGWQRKRRRTISQLPSIAP